MRLLDRYLLRELLIPLGYCLSGFMLLWVAFDLVGELGSLQSRKMLPLDIAEYYLVKMPEFLVLIAPMALLLALLYTLTNHARHNEITAIRAAGISLGRMCLPYLAVGFGASLALFALNELYVPDSSDLAEQIRNRHVPPAPGQPDRHKAPLTFTNERQGRQWVARLYDSRTGEMLEPRVLSTLPNGSHRLLSAERAVRTNGAWTFYNARESKYDLGAGSMPTISPMTNVLVKPAFTETLEEIRSEIKISANLGALSWRGTKRPDVPISELLNYLRLRSHLSRSERAWLFTKLQGRLAVPWTCLVVVLIAIPFGAASGRRNVFVGVASSVLICFLYYVVQQVCLALGAGATLPAWLAGWFPNLAFGATGLWLTARVR